MAVKSARAAGPDYQRHVNAFIDDFRRATPAERAAMVADPIVESGRLEGLVAAVVSALCRETALPAPGWVAQIGRHGQCGLCAFSAFPDRSLHRSKGLRDDSLSGRDTAKSALNRSWTDVLTMHD